MSALTIELSGSLAGSSELSGSLAGSSVLSFSCRFSCRFCLLDESLKQLDHPKTMAEQQVSRWASIFAYCFTRIFVVQLNYQKALWNRQWPSGKASFFSALFFSTGIDI